MADTEKVKQALAVLRERVSQQIDVAIVLGTGLNGVTEGIADAITIPYAEIPGFPATSVAGHAGELMIGQLFGRWLAVMCGRAHYYETGDPAVMRVPIDTLAGLGVKTIILTNAAGTLRKDIIPGQLALITDHINLSGTNPLIGSKGDRRFVSLNDAYSPRLRLRFKRAAIASGTHLKEGVYCWTSGPSFETPAEIRMMKSLGVDLVGMSTVPETILARHAGMDVAAISIVTNLAAGIDLASPSHAETRTMAATGGIGLRRLLMAFFKGLEDV